GVLDRQTQARVRLRAGATGLHGHGDLLADPGEQLAQLGVPCEDLVLAFLEDATHDEEFTGLPPGAADRQAAKIGRATQRRPCQAASRTEPLVARRGCGSIN